MSENAQKIIVIIQNFVHYFPNMCYNASTIKLQQREVIT